MPLLLKMYGAPEPTATPTPTAIPTSTATPTTQSGDSYEPNDSIDTAWGPLASGREYQAYIYSEADKNDFYYTDLSAPHPIEVWLRNIPVGANYHLGLYNAAQGQEGWSANPGSSDEHILTGALPAGRYYVRVYQASGYSSMQPYRLRVVFQ